MQPVVKEHSIGGLGLTGSFTVMRHSVRASAGSISVAECNSDALSQITSRRRRT